MRVIWEEDDLNNYFGQVVRKGVHHEHYLIGYTDGTGAKPCLVSLRDGMVLKNDDNPEQFVKMLNEEGFVPYVHTRPQVEDIIKGE